MTETKTNWISAHDAAIAGMGHLRSLAVTLRNPGNAFGCESGLDVGVAVGLASLDSEVARLVFGKREPVAALFENDLCRGEVSDELTLFDAQNLCDFTEPLGGLGFDKAVYELGSGFLLLDKQLLCFDLLGLICGQSEGLRHGLGNGNSLPGFKLLPAVHQAGGELGAKLGNYDIAVTLSNQVELFNDSIGRFFPILNLRAGNYAITHKGFNGALHIVMALFHKISNLAAGHGDHSQGREGLGELAHGSDLRGGSAGGDCLVLGLLCSSKRSIHSISNRLGQYIGPEIDGVNGFVAHRFGGFCRCPAEQFDSSLFFHASIVNRFTSKGVKIFTASHVWCKNVLR
jgi:hypothetical protein